MQVLKPWRAVKLWNMKQAKVRAIDQVSQNLLYYDFKAQLVSKNCSKNHKVCHVDFFLPFEKKFQRLVEEGLMPQLT